MTIVDQATFGAGCFWGAEATFRRVPGVLDTRVGFAVAAGADELAIEAVQVDFDPGVLNLATLIENFWQLHDPTSVDRQGGDVGAKYRSAIFVTTGEQRDAAELSRRKADESGRYSTKIVTQVLALGKFELAGEDDQQYLEKHGASSCRY
jgi:peptide-methionine (S)-S-oxide reductase